MNDPGNRPTLQFAYDPRGVVGGDRRDPAARLTTLDGLRLGVLDNTKWNANKLLRRVRDELAKAHPLSTVNYYRKESFSRFAAPELIEQIARENDFVLTAIGD